MSQGSQGVQEKQATAYAGVDSAKPYDFIGQESISFGRNLSLRGGKIKSRPKIIKRFALPKGLFQGMEYCNLKGREELVICISGGIYSVDPVQSTVKSILSSVDSTALLYGQNDPRVPRVCMEKTPSGLVIQDGQSYAVVYDGVTAKRNGGEGNIPIGTKMQYSNGRLAVAFGRYVRVGDIYDPNNPKSEWKFTETLTTNGGGDFDFGEDVQTLATLPSLDTTQGQGPLIVGTNHKISSLRLDVPSRSSWATTDKFQSVLFDSFGMVGQNAWAPVNQDILFRSTDGIRSLRRAFSGSAAVNLPLSSPVGYLFETDNLTLLKDCSCEFFDNRFLVTNGPRICWTRSFYTGITSLNLEITRQEGSNVSLEAFEGEWDSHRVLQIKKGIFSGRERCFIAGLDSDGNSVMYELLKETDTYNDFLSEDTVPIHSYESRAFFGENVDFLKRISGCEISLSGLKNPLKLNLYYRSDDYQGWRLWQTFSVTASVSGDALRNTRTYPQFRAVLRAKEPTQDLDSIKGLHPTMGYRFQLRMDWTGDAIVDKVTLGSFLLDEEVFAPGAVESGAEVSVEHHREYWYLSEFIKLSQDFIDGVSFYNPVEDPTTDTEQDADNESDEDNILEGTEGTCYRTILKKEIVLRVSPKTTWTSYSVVEQVPEGLEVSSITGGGIWDSVERTITWTISSSATDIATFRYAVDGNDGEYIFTGVIISNE